MIFTTTSENWDEHNVAKQQTHALSMRIPFGLNGNEKKCRVKQQSVRVHSWSWRASFLWLYISAYTDIIQVWVSAWVIWERTRQHARCWWLLLMKCPFLVPPYAWQLTLIVLFIHIQCWMVRHLVYVWMSVLSFDSEPFAIHWHSCFAWIMYLRWYISPLIIIVIVIISIVFVERDVHVYMYAGGCFQLVWLCCDETKWKCDSPRITSIMTVHV